MQAHFARDTKMNALRQKWLGEFQKVLPTKLAVRAMQIDRRLSLAAQTEVTSRIPLVRLFLLLRATQRQSWYDEQGEMMAVPTSELDWRLPANWPESLEPWSAAVRSPAPAPIPSRRRR